MQDALVPYKPPVDGKLAEWGLTLESSLDAYWAMAAERCHSRSVEQTEACGQMADKFDDMHGATTIEMMLSLHAHQAEAAITAVPGGKAGWIKAVEFNCGRKFKQLSGAPDSAALAVTKGKETKLQKKDTTSKFDDRTSASLGRMLIQRFPATEGVPQLPLSIKLAPTETQDTTSQCAAAQPTCACHSAIHSSLR